MLTQNEADALITLPKKSNSSEKYRFPYPGDILTIPIISLDEHEKFLIDVNRGSIRLSKCTYQERYQQMFILIRLDVDGPPHSNPEVVNVPLSILESFNGKVIECPHLHLYVEGFMDKWAIPAPDTEFNRIDFLYQTLQDFFRYCNILEPPNVHWSQTLNEL